VPAPELGCGPVWRGRRSNFLLVGVILIAVANGVILGLGLYGVLLAALKLVHARTPAFGYALLVGAGGIVVASLPRERALRHGEYLLWTPVPAEPEECPLLPCLGWVDSPEKNAFAVPTPATRPRSSSPRD
jgi:hypothetical protein